MNLSEVLNVALPELPARRIGKSNLRLHPKLIAREQIEGGVPTIVATVSGGSYVMRFTPDQWKLLQLFNGERSFAEATAIFQQETGIPVTEEQVREFTESLDEGGIWHRTALELATTGSAKIADERRRKTKKKIDLSQMTFSTWDPDQYLTRVYRRLSFVYTKWFTFLTLAVFAVMVLIFIHGWSEIWRDTMLYYTFTDKSAADLAEFWLLFCGLGFFHESAHGLTCKHFGGEVHSMGFMLVYLSPAFFCDVGEVYVYGGKWPRVAAIIAGIWVELMFCSAASIIWWGTPAGSPIHDFAYKIMLITGVAVVLMNLNPLIKLDGYYLFGELIGVPTIKENSTEYLTAWVKRRFFRLPVDVPYLHPRRRWLFVGYALLSGLYSYVVLFAVIHLVYNIFSRTSPEWAFVPALVLALLIFRARLRSAVKFMKSFYLDKRQSIRNWWGRPHRITLASLGIAIILFAPVWRETVEARFLLEPVQSAIVRAAVPGDITQVLADEGEVVEAGAPLFVLRNLGIEKETAASKNDLGSAEARTRAAELSYKNLGIALAEKASDIQRAHTTLEEAAALKIVSPVSGIISTPKLHDRLGSFVDEGDVLADIEDTTNFRARIFVPEFQVDRIRVGSPVSLKMAPFFQPIRGSVNSITPASAELPTGIEQQGKYKGIAPPKFYVATVLVSNAGGKLRTGMSGLSKIEVRRQSLAGFGWETVRDFVQRKVW